MLNRYQTEIEQSNWTTNKTHAGLKSGNFSWKSDKRGPRSFSRCKHKHKHAQSKLMRRRYRQTRCCVSLSRFSGIYVNRSRSKWMFSVFWGLEPYVWLNKGFQHVSWRDRTRRFVLRWGRRRDSRLATTAMFHEETTQGVDRRIETFGTNMANERASESSSDILVF